MATATRARRGTKAAKPVEEDVEEEEATNGRGVRPPTRLHELMAEYFNENYDADVTPEQCAIFTSKRTEFRKSDIYAEYREEQGEAAEEKANARANRAKAKDEEDDAPAPKRRPAGRTRKAAVDKDDEDEAPAAKPAPARRARRSGKAEAEEAAPTEDAPKPAATRRRRTAKPAAASEEEPF